MTKNPGSAAPPEALLERTARHERWIVLAALAAVAAAALAVTLKTGDSLMTAASPGTATITAVALVFAMWWTMMMAMMLPSAAPAILTFAAVSRNFAAKGGAAAPLTAFASGYATIWTGFSAAAVVLQMAIAAYVPLTGMFAVPNAAFGGGLLIAAGLYQLTPFKQSCLRQCQSPLLYFARNWRSGAFGAWRMGLRHGLSCLGCCWVLMGLLFYGGVMEPRWIIGLAAYVAAEKLIPAPWRLSRFTGVALIVWGLWVLSRTLS